MIDVHSHILPWIDDGSRSLEESMEMLRQEAEQGIQRVVATPHFYAHHDDLERFLLRREYAQKMLREKMAGENGLPDLSIGAEVYFFQGISDSELINQLTFDKKRCILIEMPPSPWPEFVYRELEAIWRRRGITPVVAHIDRYIAPFRTHKIPQRLQQLPVLVQANAEFFLEKATAGMALRMLKAEQIQLLGSDCHNMTSRPPLIGKAFDVIKKRCGADYLCQMNEFGYSLFDINNHQPSERKI